jgi:hypothetical protein
MKPALRQHGCGLQYRYAVRANDRGKAVSIGKLGMGKTTNVVATWCERCGMISVGPSDVRHYPRARVLEDFEVR